MVAAIAATAWAVLGRLDEEPPVPPPPIQLAFPVPAGTELGSADDALDAALSPDEQSIAFVATTGGVAHLWLRRLADADARMLPGTAGARFPAWKHTGRVIAFFADGQLKIITLGDRRVHTLTAAPAPAGAVWRPDGSIVFAGRPEGGLQRFANGLSPGSTISDGDVRHVFPFDGGGTGTGTTGYVAVRTDGRRVVRINGVDVTDTTGHAAMAGTQLVYARDGVLVARNVDALVGQRAGSPAATAASASRTAPVATSVGVSDDGHASFALSRRLLVAAPAAPRRRELAWFDGGGRRLAAVGEPGNYWQVRLSPDDEHVAVTLVDPLLKSLDVMTMPTDRPGDREKLSLALAADTDPVWSPDGSRIVFRSMEDGAPALFWRRARDPQAPLEAGPIGDYTPTDWQRGTVLVTTAGESDDIEALDPVSGMRTPVAATGFDEREARWSPDGRRVAHVSTESGQPDVYVQRGDARTRAPVAGGHKPRWSADGRGLYFARGDEILRADLIGDRFTAPRIVATISGLRDFDVAHCSTRLLVLRTVDGPPVAAHVVVDWATPLAAAHAPRRR